MAENANYTYLPWVRLGLAALIPTEDTLGQAPLPGRSQLPVQLAVDLDGTSELTPEILVGLRGPGDVVGLEAGEVLRTEPSSGSADVEPNYFAHIEFGRVDLPWLFTPAAAQVGESKLRPWMVLVVVEDRTGVSVTSGAGNLDQLVIDDNAQDELPDLADSWAWAHVQVSGTVGGIQELKTLLKDSPQLVISRLMCPRFLAEDKKWIACLVPAFDRGRKAGLGLSLNDADFDDLIPAWNDIQTDAKLPVYHHWSFTTGKAGDFETLARRLQPFPMPATVGVLPLDVGHAGSGLPPSPVGGDVLSQYRGALVSPAAPDDPWDTTHRQDFEAELTLALSLTVQPDEVEDPVVGPPLYGRWHAAVDGLPTAGATPLWLRELNLHPAFRATAGLATNVIRERQEALMQSAWEQVGDVVEANRSLRQAQLAREVSLSAKARHFDTLSDDARVQLASPALSRVRLPSGFTAHGDFSQSSLPKGTASGGLRRMARPQGPSSRRVAGQNEDWAGRILSRVTDPTTPLGTDNAIPTPNGMGTVGHITAVASVPGAVDDSLSELDAVLPGFSQFGSVYSETSAPEADIGAVRLAVTETLDPTTALLQHVQDRVRLDELAPGRADFARAEPFDPIFAAPDFPQPMYESLSSERLVPGLDAMPFNAVGVLIANASFVESFMVGLSHEMARELLWREYPTDQRGTYFRQFWDVSGAVPAPVGDLALEAARDLPPIHTWDSSAALGDSLQGVTLPDAGSGATDRVVVLIRGELLRRYPNTVIYLAQATWSGTQRVPLINGTDEVHSFPIFTGRLDHDVQFFAFDVSESALRGAGVTAGPPFPVDAGWFVVFQQQPTEPRFGMDDVAPAPATELAELTTWDDLAWQSVPVARGEHVSFAGTQPDIALEGATWARNGGHIAKITLQTPARVLFHGSALLSQEG